MYRIVPGILAALLTSCASSDPELPERHYVVTYYDRNHDGIVDFELHRLPGGADTDWALVDRAFRGNYDVKVRWGVARTTSPVSIAVPRNVPITAGSPPVWISPEIEPPKA